MGREESAETVRNRKVQSLGWKTKKTDKSIPKNLLIHENFHQYMEDSTLHCFKYAGDRALSSFERFFFALSLLLVFLLSAFFISKIYVKWSSTPVIITLSSEPRSVSKLPFPAVTICNMNRVQLSAVEKLPFNSMEYSVIRGFCSANVEQNITVPESGKWQDFRDVLLKVAQSCDRMFIRCRYGGSVENCSEIFQTVLTDEGLCCIFNGVHKKFIMNREYNRSREFSGNDDHLTGKAINWGPEKGFSVDHKNRTMSNYPRAILGIGNNMGLSLTLKVDVKEYYCSSRSSYGFKVLLHPPNEYPKIARYGISVANGFETFVSVTPTISEASDSIRHIKSSVRQCLFDNENHLTFYRSYSRGNCKMECESKIYARHCDCVMDYMPRANDNVTICGLSDGECIADVDHQIHLKVNKSFVCECLPGCFDIDYENEISMAPIMPILEFTPENLAVLHIFFKQHDFRSQNKEELVNFTEFLSNTGGILGLFLGFSVLSIIEILYFMLMRPYFEHIRYYQSHRMAVWQILRKTLQCFGFKKKPANTTAINAIDEKQIIYPYID